MRLSWNEIRARAARFADEWASATYEKGEAQSFYNDFFDVFGVQRRKVATFGRNSRLCVRVVYQGWRVFEAIESQNRLRCDELDNAGRTGRAALAAAI